MIDNERLVLRQAFYHAWGAYHQAMANYWAAVAHDRAHVDAGRVVAVRTAAAALDSALTSLLAYLSQLEPAARVHEERMRLARVQELLQHELALLLHDGGRK